MNSFKNLLSAITTAALLVVGFNAHAQRGFDEFGGATTVQFMKPTQISSGSASLTTNMWIDEHMFDGIAKIDIQSWAAGTESVYMYCSPDTTNWTLLANWALATNLAVKYTNLMYGGTNLFTTNNYSSSGVQTVPVSATAGFASTYFVPQSFTNTFPLFVTTSGTYTIGYDVSDAGRYLEMVVSNGSAIVTNIISASLTTHIESQINNGP